MSIRNYAAMTFGQLLDSIFERFQTEFSKLQGIAVARIEDNTPISEKVVSINYNGDDFEAKMKSILNLLSSIVMLHVVEEKEGQSRGKWQSVELTELKIAFRYERNVDIITAIVLKSTESLSAISDLLGDIQLMIENLELYYLPEQLRATHHPFITGWYLIMFKYFDTLHPKLKDKLTSQRVDELYAHLETNPLITTEILVSNIIPREEMLTQIIYNIIGKEIPVVIFGYNIYGNPQVVKSGSIDEKLHETISRVAFSEEAPLYKVMGTEEIEEFDVENGYLVFVKIASRSYAYVLVEEKSDIKTLEHNLDQFKSQVTFLFPEFSDFL